jgi:hypothetical protein
MLSILKWFFPPYWLWGVPKVIVTTSVKWVWKATVAAWNKLPKPKSKLGKCIVYPIYGWLAMPGTIGLTAYWLADLVGYGEEVRELMAWSLDLFGVAGWALLDVVGKALLFGGALLLRL